MVSDSRGPDTPKDPRIGPWLEKALASGEAIIFTESGREWIHYVEVDRKEIFDHPEEWVRADFWAELIYRYGYPAKRIAVEVPVPDRVPGDVVDLAVCRDDERMNPFAVVECKPAGCTDAEFDQAVEQAVGNGTWAKMRADYAMVVAGPRRRVLDFVNYGIRQRKKNIIADLPSGYSTTAQAFRYVKGDAENDIRPVSRDEMLMVLKKCHDTLWGGGKLSPPQAFSELCKVIFVKIADEKQTKRGEPYEVQIRSNESPRDLAARVEALYRTHRRAEPDIFTSEISVQPETLVTLVEHIQGVNISATDIDVKGLAFERFMDSFFKGDFGQYFTPREVISFAVEMIDVEPGEFVIDPAAGSAGFLLHALELVRQKADEYESPGSPEHFRLWLDFANNHLYGIEINDEIARVAKMNMILHGDGHTNIVCEDALAPASVLQKQNRNLTFEAFDVVLTNPPFGATIRLEERPYLKDYVLGNTRSKKGKLRPRKTQASEILFLERIWQFLKPATGRAAVVMPDGILTNPRSGYVRDFIHERFQTLAVVSLPVSAFMYYGAGVKASVLFLRKLGKNEVPDADAPTFLAEADLIGYDATGREVANQLPEIVEAYRRFLKNPDEFLVEIPTLPFDATSKNA